MTILLIIIYAAFISLGLPDSLLGTAWPVMYYDFGASISDAGIIFTIASLGTVAASFCSAKIIRYVGTGKTTAFSTLLTALALLGCAYSPSFFWLCAVSIPLGFGAGAIDAALNNYVALHYQARHMNWLHCFWGIGVTISPLIMAHFLAINHNWREGYSSVALIQGILAAILIFTLPLWKQSDTNTTTQNEIVCSENHSALRIPGVRISMVIFFLYCSMEASAMLWGASYLVKIRQVTVSDAANFVALLCAGISIGRFLSGLISSRLSNMTLIRIGEITTFASVTLLCLPLPAQACIAIFFLFGMGCAPIYPSMMHETPVRFKRDASQAVMGLQMGAAYIGITCVPSLFGFLSDLFSMDIFAYVLLLLIVLIAILSELLHKITFRNRLTIRNN